MNWAPSGWALSTRVSCRCGPEHLVGVLHALIEGLVMQRILTPELCPDELFYEAFAALAPTGRAR